MLDREADEFDRLIRGHYAEVWRLCGALVDRDAADDLAQETFMRAGRALSEFRGDSSPRTWLLSIARRTCVDELRGRSRRSIRDSRMIEQVRRSHDDGPVGRELEARDLIARLDPDRRAAFALTQLLGLSYAEAAVVCECAVGTIRSRVARARMELIDLVQDRPRSAEDGGG